MARIIQISSGDISLPAKLEDNPTADAIWEALPITGSVSRWGEEIYFSIPVDLTEAGDARQEMAVGELGYWPPGKAFCIFWGRTPASVDDTPRAASNVNPFGQVEGDATEFSAVPNGAAIEITRIE